MAFSIPSAGRRIVGATEEQSLYRRVETVPGSWPSRRSFCAMKRGCWPKPSSCQEPLSDSHLQIALRHRRVGCQCRRRARPHHLSLLDDRVPVGELHQRAEMLVDEENGLALRLQAREALPDLKPQQRLVEGSRLFARTSGVRRAFLAPAQSCTLKRPCRAPDISRANCAWLM